MTRKKGQLTTSDYLTIEDFKRLLDGLHQDKLFAWEFYCRVSFYTAFRASDVRSLTWQDLLNRKELMRVEQKTAKGRRIVLEEGFANEVSHFYQLLGSPAVDEPFFLQPSDRKGLWIRIYQFEIQTVPSEISVESRRFFHALHTENVCPILF